MKTYNETAMNKKALMTFSYGGSVEVETSKGVWTKISAPLELMDTSVKKVDVSKLRRNYRPSV